ncbi:hypothetical protein [Fusobacterium polymorphum]|uniref:RES domain-containing protein n=1 Tax=Fusobacterium nucleatum subsp. polymorphum TaxID=76857 RepID=A0A241Q387_FUSNP|nr:hypothetical protein [Fusobacterium polymorphum]ASG29188.1 hypothetical protein CBG61_10040 [Fusobacterium polymorphum]
MEEKQCIFCFFSDKYQRKIMKYSQLQEEKFEDILDRYKKIFITKLNVIINITKPCSKHNKILNFELILSNIKNINDLSSELMSFFEGIKKTYKLWISGETFSAIQNFEELLKENKLLEEDDFSINEKIFFRGRNSLNKILNKYEMFHIPYDKRYLVGNQRFSLSGFPLLYLNSSLKGVLSELNIEEKDSYEKYAFSSFHFNKKAKIYSLDNPFRIYFEKVSNNIDKVIKEPSFSSEDLKKILLKLIIASVCLFEKRVSHKNQEDNGINIFYEEYIIPQALTQVLKKNKYNGILYPSTRIKETENSGLFNISNFNLVYFPKYNDKKHYDSMLFESLDISVPITPFELKNNDIISDDEFNSLKEIISKIMLKDLILRKDFRCKLYKLYNMYKIYKKYKEKNFKAEEIYTIEKFFVYNFLLKNLLDIEEDIKKEEIQNVK